VIYNLVEYLNSVSEENFDADDAYEEILEEIDDLIKAFSDTDMFANDVLASWTSYITKDLEVIGTKIDIFGIIPNGTATLYIAKATDGDDVGSTISARVGSETYFEMDGTLVDDGKTLSGTYEISVQGESLAFIDLENVNVKKLEDKYFVGSISISPSRNLVDLIVEESGVGSFAGLNIASLSVKLDVEENDGQKIKATMSILNGTSSYASVSFDTEIGDGEKITIPSNTSSDAEKWFASLDFNSLVENAESSGIPDYVIELIEMLTLGIG
jgi:hypothetical protein